MGERRPNAERPLGSALVRDLLNRLVGRLEASGLAAEAQVSRTEGAEARIVARRGRERFTLLLDAAATGEPRRALETIGRAHLKGPGEEKAYWIFGAPYVSPRTVDLCRRGGVGAIDLAGNIHIDTGPLLLSACGNEEVRQDRKVQRLLFSPKASRISLALLLNPETPWTQRALAGEARISIGLVNRTIRELIRQHYVEEEGSRWRLADREALLGAWARDHAARGPRGERFATQMAIEELESLLDRDADEKGYRYALARESAAKYRAPFAPVMNLVFYSDAPAGEVAARLGLKPAETGWNVEILAPRDEGVFTAKRRVLPGGRRKEDAPGLGRTLTNDIYLYLDLWSHPARGKEQAEQLLNVMGRESRRRKRSAAEDARFLEFMKLRDDGHDRIGKGRWEDAVSCFEQALATIEGIADEEAEESRERERFFLWLTLEHLVREVWDQDRARRNSLLARMREEIPPDEEVLRRYPPYRMEPALVRYLLGTRHAVLAASDRGAQQNHASLVALQYFKTATSPYTQGAREVAAPAEEVRDWLRKVADVDISW